MKYKLIKTYPGSPKLDSIVKLKNNGSYELENSTSYFMTKDKVEDYPEFWELVVEKQKLFTTFDGVDIFECDDVHWVCDEFVYFYTQNVDKTCCNFINGSRKGIFKIFATKEKAEEYILMNKPVLSLNDYYSLFDEDIRDYCIGEKLKNLVKEKLK